MAIDRLYHYTDAAGLLGILGKPHQPPEIWLSQIQYMNDSKEWWHAYELLNGEIRKFRDHPHPLVARFAQEHIYQVESQANSSGSYPVHGPFQRTFVFSVSENDDLLSQWRGYTPNGGYSVGFSFEALQRLAALNNFELLQCEYDLVEKRELIHQALRSIADDIVAGSISSEINAHGLEGEQAIVGNAKVALSRKLSKFACYFKHESFKEEAEWRLAGVVPAGGTDARERWRTRHTQILPYCAIELPDDDSNFPVESVTVGPGVDVHLAEHSIRFVRFGRPPVKQVKPSSATLRR